MNKQHDVNQGEVHVVFGEETAFWKANCEELSARYPGKWLLIHGSEVVDALDTFSEAARALRGLNAIALIQPVDPGMTKDAIFLATIDGTAGEFTLDFPDASPIEHGT